jgi:hypothetical protein
MGRVPFANEPLLLALLHYWDEKRGRRAMPRRRDIDPLEMPPRLLPHLQLIELGERGRLRLRLVGTAIVDAVGKDATGRYLDEAFEGDARRFLEELCRTVLRERRPVAASCWQPRAKGPALGMTWLATPLSENDREANMILSATTFRFARPRSLGDLPLSPEAIEVL